MITILDSEKPEYSPQERVEADFRSFLWLKKSVDDMTVERDSVKKRLMHQIEASGVTDDKGHSWLDFEMPVEGYARMQRQKRIAQKLDEQEAERLLSELGLRDRAYKTIEVLDEDAVMGMLVEGLLTEQDIDRMFPKTVTFAFVPVKA